MTATAPEPPPASDDPGQRGEPPCAQRPAVRWLSPGQLLKTGKEVAVSAYFAKYADKRESMASVPTGAYDLSALDRGVGDRFVIDYVADTGDGFNATYAVACSVTRAETVVAPLAAPEELDNCTCQTPGTHQTAGSLLVLGGDQVYPVADVRDYDERFKNVYAVAAAAGRLGHRHYVAAIPGNHDWYDGLVAFRRNFCESWINYDPPSGSPAALPADERLDRIAAWRAFQSRSYFAVKLPHDWWLWGVDSQLEAQVDAVQMDFFRTVRDLMDRTSPRGRVILATARPSWCDDPAQNDASVLSPHQYLCWFLDKMFPDDEWKSRVRLVLTGDKHHYARYEPSDRATEPDLVTCGGGGAFLSSTHHLRDEITPFWDEAGYPQMSRTTYARTHEYPEKARSKELRWRALLTPFRNPSLVPFIGGVYALLLVALAASTPTGEGWFLSRLPALGEYGWRTPSVSLLGQVAPMLLAGLALLCLLVAFASHGSGGRTWPARVAGLLHWVGHLALVALAGDRFRAASEWLEAKDDEWGDVQVLVVALLGAAALLLAFGLAGTLLMAAYLLGSDRFGLHDNESFASFRYEGYKSHLRIHVAEDALHVRAIGIRDVPKKWTHDGTVFHPEGNQPAASEEIDAFVVARGPDPAPRTPSTPA